MFLLSENISPYIKQNNNDSASHKDDIMKKGQTDSFGKENRLESEDDEKYNEEKCKHDYHRNSFPNQRIIYMKTTETKRK